MLRYPGTTLTIALHDAPEVEQALREVITGWSPVVAAPPPEAGAGSQVHCDADGYSTRSGRLDEALTGLGLASATCAVIADLAEDFFETRPGCLARHCGAVRYNGRLIGMTGPARAGKSTLVARLSAETDMEIFCDDVLPMPDDGRAFALGIAPRLRLPLPAACSDAFRAHVLATIGPHDDRYGYLRAPTIAPHGTRADLSVLLILDRREEGGATLHEVTEGAALRAVLAQNISDLVTADAAYARMSDLLANVTCLRLVYADLEDAMALLRGAFGSDDMVAPGTVIHPARETAPGTNLPAAQADPGLRWMQDSGISLQEREGATFLWKIGTSMIWHMNAHAHAVWTMLEIPGSAVEIGEVVALVFPGEDEDRIVADVNALLQALAKAGMIVPAPEARAAT